MDAKCDVQKNSKKVTTKARKNQFLEPFWPPQTHVFVRFWPHVCSMQVCTCECRHTFSEHGSEEGKQQHIEEQQQTKKKKNKQFLMLHIKHLK